MRPTLRDSAETVALCPATPPRRPPGAAGALAAARGRPVAACCRQPLRRVPKRETQRWSALGLGCRAAPGVRAARPRRARARVPPTSGPADGARTSLTTCSRQPSSIAWRATACSRGSAAPATRSRGLSYWESRGWQRPQRGGAPVAKPGKAVCQNPKEIRAQSRKSGLTKHREMAIRGCSQRLIASALGISRC